MELISIRSKVLVKNNVEIVVDGKRYVVCITNGVCNGIYQIHTIRNLTYSVKVGKALKKITGYSIKDFMKLIEESKASDEYEEDEEDEDFEQGYPYDLDIELEEGGQVNV